MKQTILLFFCLTSSLNTALFSQPSPIQIGLDVDTYQLPTNRTSVSDFAINNYYKIEFNQQKSVPMVSLNQKQLGKYKLYSFLASSLYQLTGINNYGSIGLPSPTLNPLINSKNNSNDYLLIQQHNIQRSIAPRFLVMPRGLSFRK